MNAETILQNEIRLALNNVAISYRANVGVFYTRDGGRISTGLPNGFPDLFGFRISDGKMFFLEIKTKTGRLSKDQIKFKEMISKYPVIYGVARTVDEAIELIETGTNESTKKILENINQKNGMEKLNER